ncbi:MULTISPECIES: hydroxymethylglutaryl-CoA lyase [Sphingobacterium]|uniref:Hydroxymethylglutaryl-CoA lyase n=1 Tax=Sphingobacterium athyrii TaxID=2152717 RepID=A0A363NYW6_9SPHI|nr:MULTISPECIES: hydroxymethylglutaryl-CoA lyase [Sphingobacterium]PUV26002.1 hydroxymethylglutaryl-CoA lyase [Sphingobacterium athyrii]QIH33125.1 hydroxymethylglutaryl-CoA lyase [Sphingobacterium sp. DR205]
MKDQVVLVDCPRDAIQGLHNFIATDKKIKHINRLIESGLFDVIDFGSFVSPKAVPQLADTKEVLAGVKKDDRVKLLAIVANLRGVQDAVQEAKIDLIGYPFSISETFQLRNTNKGLEESYQQLKEMKALADAHGKVLVVYISMAFGNPYNDPWSAVLVEEWIDKLMQFGITEFSLADTTSEANAAQITDLYGLVRTRYPQLAIGAHFHAKREDSLAKVRAAYDAGCRKFEGALLGYGGCPFAKDDLVGNIPSEILLDLFGRGSLTERARLEDSFRQMIL